MTTDRESSVEDSPPRLPQAAALMAVHERLSRDSAAALAVTLRQAVQVLTAVALCAPGAQEISVLERALCRQHLADVVALLVAWGEPARPGRGQRLPSALLPQEVAQRLSHAHRADPLPYHQVLGRLLGRLCLEPPGMLSVQDLALLDEIAAAVMLTCRSS